MVVHKVMVRDVLPSLPPSFPPSLPPSLLTMTSNDRPYFVARNNISAPVLGSFPSTTPLPCMLISSKDSSASGVIEEGSLLYSAGTGARRT